MDEADRLCDRIAIVDHGKLVALDSPHGAEGERSGNECHRGAVREPAGGLGASNCTSCRDVTSVQAQSAGMYRVLLRQRLEHDDSPGSMAVEAGVAVKSLSVQNTTLDDVFVHYTGRQLRDEQVKAFGFVMPPGRGCGHEQDVCDCRARDAEVLSLAGL